MNVTTAAAGARAAYQSSAISPITVDGGTF
jgi:hypothetical protein